MASAKGLSGFPEWLPEQEIVQQEMIAGIRRQFELHGFGPLHTRSLEKVEDLVGKGETDKEIYVVRRWAAGAEDPEASLGLHYDLTVPFARYVSENRGQLVFPFRRYQIQPAWRGERPQHGRFREFLQADVDVIGQGSLDIRYDAELVRLLHDVLASLPVPPVKLLVNNRKLLEGFYRGLGITDVTRTLRTMDKLDKIGPEKARIALAEVGLDAAQIAQCLALAELEITTAAGLEQVRTLGVSHPLLDEGLSELGRVLEACRGTREGSVVAALRIARGFDYYTGTVVEGVLEGHPTLGSVCSGGRYDDLASSGKQALPGMGVSIGVTRLLAYCFHLDLLETKRKTPARVSVVVHSEARRAESDAVAQTLRSRGIACLVSDRAVAYGKQMADAERLGIRFVWFPGDPHEVKDIVSGVQSAVDLAGWVVPASG